MKRWFIALGMVLLVIPVMGRGKNKIPYDDFEWKMYESTHFNVYYYEAEAHLLEDIVDLAEAAYRANADALQHEIDFKIPLVFYKTHEEFEQTNVFPGFVPHYVGAFAEPFQSRLVLPVDMPRSDLYELMRHELTHIFQYSMLFNNKISTILRANAPTWLIEGMASYVADDEDNFSRMVLRDAAINSNFRSLSDLSGLSYMAYRVGHAVFNFMEENWGIEGIRNFLWEYRKNITGRVESALEKAFEMEPAEFDRKFRKYLRKRYIDMLPEKEEPDDHAREIRTRKVFTTISPELSPSGDLFAAFVPHKNDLDLMLVSTKDGRIFKNLTKGHTNEYTELSVNAFSGINDLAWARDGNEIAFLARKEGTNILFVVNVVTGKTMEVIKPKGLRGMLSPEFSADGKTLFFSANQNGHQDLFSHDRETGEVRNLTQDEFVDRNPRLSRRGDALVYSSNRDGFFKIYMLNLETLEKTQLTSGLGNDIQATFAADDHAIFFSSDRYDDIYNIYRLDLDTGQMHQYTDVLTGAFAPQERILFDHREGEESRQLVFTAYYEGRFRIYSMEDPDDRMEPYQASSDNFKNVKEHVDTVNFKLEEEKKQDYRMFKNFTVSGVDVTAGMTDDGRFLTASNISFSDVLGNHNLNIDAYSISSYESYFADYLNLSNRWQWGVQFNSTQYFFVDRYYRPGERLDRLYKFLQLIGYVRYPFSLFSRLDFGAGMTDDDSYRVDIQDGYYVYNPVDFTAPYLFVALSRDTIRYNNQFGPQHGMGLDLAYRTALDNYESVRLDFRAYRELTRRSLIAFRLRADHSEGDAAELFYLGGGNNLRGDYYYNEFAGTRRLLTQLEFRFPFIDRLGFPGFELRSIRGNLFAEVGGAWSDDDLFEFGFEDSETWNPDEPDTDYLIGSYGFEISMFLLGLELHWTWAKRTNWDSFPSSSRFSFWIGRTF